MWKPSMCINISSNSFCSHHWISLSFTQIARSNVMIPSFWPRRAIVDCTFFKTVDSAEFCLRAIDYRAEADVYANGNRGVNHNIEVTPTGHFLFFCGKEFHLKWLHWCHPYQCPNKIHHTGCRMQAFSAFEPFNLYIPGETGNRRPLYCLMD